MGTRESRSYESGFFVPKSSVSMCWEIFGLNLKYKKITQSNGWKVSRTRGTELFETEKIGPPTYTGPPLLAIITKIVLGPHYEKDIPTLKMTRIPCWLIKNDQILLHPSQITWSFLGNTYCNVYECPLKQIYTNIKISLKREKMV